MKGEASWRQLKSLTADVRPLIRAELGNNSKMKNTIVDLSLISTEFLFSINFNISL